MSISYNPIIGVGKVFSDYEEAVDWFLKNFHEASIEDINKDGLEAHFLRFRTLSGFEASPVDCYTGDGYVIYIPLYGEDVTRFSDSLFEATRRWVFAFGTKPEIVSEVCIS